MKMKSPKPLNICLSCWTTWWVRSRKMLSWRVLEWVDTQALKVLILTIIKTLDKNCVVWTYLAGRSDGGCDSSSIFWILAKGKDKHGEASHFLPLSDELDNVSDLEELALAVRLWGSAIDVSFPPTSSISILLIGFCSTRANTGFISSR